MKGVRAKVTGSVMHGKGLKWKYRAHPDEGNMKGKATRGKK